MNFILQFNAFFNWVNFNGISHAEVDLYFAIFNIANKSGWKTYFSIPNASLGRFSKNTITRARKKLAEYGLIEYKKGTKGRAPLYRLIPLYDTNIGTQNDTNMHPKKGTYINKNINKNIYNYSKNAFEVFSDDYNHEKLESLTRKRYD